MSEKQSARILIIDDEPELRELLVDALSDTGMMISVAGSGKEACEKARAERPDLIITDLCLGDCSGLDVIDQLRSTMGDLPAVVITGRGDAQSLTEASQRRPVELMTKPLDLQRLRGTISEELNRLAEGKKTREQADRLRELIRSQQTQRHRQEGQLRRACGGMSKAYRALGDQMLAHQTVIRYQLEMIAAKNDDEVFRSFFRTFVRQAGAVYGVAMVCDSNAELRITGRFGVPKPDSLEFCRSLSDPMIDMLMVSPQVQILDAMDERDSFDLNIHRYLPGINILAVPLIPAPGEMIGVVILYRKGEQPFAEEDLDLVQMLSFPTAVAIRRND